MKVLFATDSRTPALAAQELLEKIGNRSTIDISVLSVTTFNIVVPERPLVFIDPDDARRKGAGRLIDRTVWQLRTAGFQAQGFTAEGNPSDQILEFIEDEGIDLTILGAGHRSWLGNVTLGSTSSYVLHHSPTATLIVHSRPSKRSVAKVMVALDGSPEADEGLGALAQLVDPQRCTIEVYSVAEPPQALPYPMLVPYPAADVKGSPEQEQRKKERAEQIALRGAEELRGSGFEATAQDLFGDPASTLIEVARHGGCDLVVVGSRGLSPVRRALFGSVSEPIVRKASAALVARSPHTEEAEFVSPFVSPQAAFQS